MAFRDLIGRLLPKSLAARRPQVAVVRLYGVLTPMSSPLRPALNLADSAAAIEQAFRLRGTRAVALAVNSPGGSPVQAALLHDRIRLLADEKKLPVYVFCEDVAASGGYWIACAGDEIYADASSIVGSIGVISASFGFEDLIRKLGVERRLHTSGARKSFLDPFRPEQEDDLERLRALQQEIHDGFKQHVQARRGARLTGDDATLFSGEFWTGRQARELGLIDGLGDLKTVLRAKFGDKVNLRLVGAARLAAPPARLRHRRRRRCGPGPGCGGGVAGRAGRACPVAALRPLGRIANSRQADPRCRRTPGPNDSRARNAISPPARTPAGAPRNPSGESRRGGRRRCRPRRRRPRT